MTRREPISLVVCRSDAPFVKELTNNYAELTYVMSRGLNGASGLGVGGSCRLFFNLQPCILIQQREIHDQIID